METISKRLSQFIESTGLSKNKFASHIGTSSALISKLTTQDIDFRIDILDKIISRYPSLNLNWLLTGIGEMYDFKLTTESGEEILYSELKSQGRLNYPARFNEYLRTEEPEMWQLGHDLGTVFSFTEFLDHLGDTYLGGITSAGARNLKNTKSFQAYKELCYKAYLEGMPYKEIFRVFAVSINKFCSDIYGVKDEIGLDFEGIEDYIE